MYRAIVCIVLIYIIGPGEIMVNGTETVTVKVKFLRGVHRLFSTANFTDFYFSCSALGNYILWNLDGRPLSGFITTETGRVRRNVGPYYNYTATLLSSQLYNDSVMMVLDSMIVVSFPRNYPNFKMTCRGSHGVKTISPGTVIDSDSIRNGALAFQRLFSSAITMNQTYIHGFLCGGSSILQLSGDVGPTIAFTTLDSIGFSRIALKSDIDSILVQGILFAHEPLQTTSIFLVALDGSVTAKCFYKSDEIILTSDLPIPPLKLPPLTTSISTTQRLPTQPRSATTDPKNATTEPKNATTDPKDATTEPKNATTEPKNATTISSVYTEGHASPGKVSTVAVWVSAGTAIAVFVVILVVVVILAAIKRKNKKFAMYVLRNEVTKLKDDTIIVLNPSSINALNSQPLQAKYRGNQVAELVVTPIDEGTITREGLTSCEGPALTLVGERQESCREAAKMKQTGQETEGLQEGNRARGSQEISRAACKNEQRISRSPYMGRGTGVNPCFNNT